MVRIDVKIIGIRRFQEANTCGVFTDHNKWVLTGITMSKGWDCSRSEEA